MAQLDPAANPTGCTSIDSATGEDVATETHLVTATALGTIAGAAARWRSLKIDYRQYPSYPQGYTIHMALAVVAAFLGAAAVPALLAGDYTAASFLALAATQFREVRGVERETLRNLEASELVPRGEAYIEGIARAFEARNYLTMLTGLASGGAAAVVGLLEARFFVSLGAAAIGALVVWYTVKGGVTGPKVGDLVDLEIVSVEFEGPILTVAGITLMNIGLPEARETYRKDGIGVLMRPKNPDAKATMADLGQRQAIAHDASALVGVIVEPDEPHFMPLVRRSGRTGHVVMAIVPAEKNPAAVLEAVRGVPVLEASIRKPTASKVGRMID